MRVLHTIEREGVEIDLEVEVKFHRESDEFRSWWMCEVLTAVTKLGKEIELTEVEELQVEERAREQSVQEDAAARDAYWDRQLMRRLGK